ncbi:acyltransferase [Phyllobacterium sp. SB3]|uniref:acyltransferase n=1 Tax=Phyllobacterium sp. SB3 TaxID=3156073 RepID=UPI0032AE8582
MKLINPSPPISTSSARHAGIDAGRWVAFIAVVILHVFPTHDSGTVSWRAILDVICRFAVPFFFLASGFFLSQKPKGFWNELTSKIRRLFPLFVVWAIFYIVLSPPPVTVFFSAYFLKDLLINGGPGFHLWFLPSLGFCLALFIILKRFFSQTVLLGFGAVLYCLGLSYGEFENYPGLPDMHWDVRNGPFFGFFFIAIGYFFKRKQFAPSPAHCLLLAGTGLLCQLAEADLLFVSEIRGFADDINFYFGTVAYACGVFLYCSTLKANRGVLKLAAELGKYTLGFYCLHVAIIWMLDRLSHPVTFMDRTQEVMETIMLTVLFVLAMRRYNWSSRLIK